MTIVDRMQMRCLILLMFLPMLLSAQSVYLHATHPVYRFLDKMEAKQVIVGYRDAVKPLSRKNIAQFLIRTDTTSIALTAIEQEEQAFFKEEFFLEMQNAGYENLIEERWNLYQYRSDIGNFNIDLTAGLTYHDRADGAFTRILSNGILLYGYYGSAIGASFSYRDNEEAGSFISGIHPLTPTPSQVVINIAPPHFYYDPNEAQVSVDLGLVTLTAEKSPNTWGTGERGTLILSNKAPSYPQFKIRAKLSNSIDFTYLHGWLFSGILDSARMYQVPGVPGILGERQVYRQKYIAAHIVEFSPWDGVDLAVGESQVYGSRSPEPMYLIPVMFFKAGEHWMKDTDNSQMFLTADLNVVKDQNYHLTLFVDEISTTDMFTDDKQHNQIGFTAGGSWYDALFEDSRLMTEYTRTNPWVYNHRYSDATFRSHDVTLGHWIGQNADLFTIGYSQRFSRSLEAGIMFESLRKGGKDSTTKEYRLPTPSFLYGPLTKQQTLSLTVTMEPFRDLTAEVMIARKRFTTQVTPTTRDFLENPNDYVPGTEVRGAWDMFIGLRYNFE